MIRGITNIRNLFGISLNTARKVNITKQVRIPLRVRRARELRRVKLSIKTFFDFLTSLGFEPKATNKTILLVIVKHRKQANLVRKRINQIKDNKDCKIYYIYLNEQESKERIKRLFYLIASFQVQNIYVVDYTEQKTIDLFVSLLNNVLKFFSDGCCEKIKLS